MGAFAHAQDDSHRDAHQSKRGPRHHQLSQENRPNGHGGKEDQQTDREKRIGMQTAYP